MAFGSDSGRRGWLPAGRARGRASAQHWLREVDAEQLADCGPRQLWGGQAQPDGARGLAADVTADAAAELGLPAGERASFCVKAQEVTLHPVASHR